MSVHVAMRSIAFPGALKFSKLEKYGKILRWIYCYRKRLYPNFFTIDSPKKKFGKILLDTETTHLNGPSWAKIRKQNFCGGRALRRTYAQLAVCHHYCVIAKLDAYILYSEKKTT